MDSKVITEEAAAPLHPNTEGMGGHEHDEEWFITSEAAATLHPNTEEMGGLEHEEEWEIVGHWGEMDKNESRDEKRRISLIPLIKESDLELLGQEEAKRRIRVACEEQRFQKTGEANAPATEADVIRMMLSTLKDHGNRMAAAQCCSALYRVHPSSKEAVKAAGGLRALCEKHENLLWTEGSGGGMVTAKPESSEAPEAAPMTAAKKASRNKKRRLRRLMSLFPDMEISELELWSPEIADKRIRDASRSQKKPLQMTDKIDGTIHTKVCLDGTMALILYYVKPPDVNTVISKLVDACKANVDRNCQRFYVIVATGEIVNFRSDLHLTYGTFKSSTVKTFNENVIRVRHEGKMACTMSAYHEQEYDPRFSYGSNAYRLNKNQSEPDFLPIHESYFGQIKNWLYEFNGAPEDLKAMSLRYQCATCCAKFPSRNALHCHLFHQSKCVRECVWTH